MCNHRNYNVIMQPKVFWMRKNIEIKIPFYDRNNLV